MSTRRRNLLTPTTIEGLSGTASRHYRTNKSSNLNLDSLFLVLINVVDWLVVVLSP